MKGLIKLGAAMFTFTTAIFVVGCAQYRDVVDPCWPARYNSIARQSVRDMHFAQEEQGHKLDQTIWDHHFDSGTPNLNASGKDHLRYISRRQPVPDTHIWLQWPSDVTKDRDSLIDQRKKSIRDFLTAHTRHGNGAAYQIDVHDIAVPVYPSEWTNSALKKVGDDISKGAVGNQSGPSGIGAGPRN
ncbi:MAG: hypothetical protein FJ303_17270 [Planctomycetes bacterium]|nr:hypothetical protein [Planctomycetota bacterium]